MSIFYISIFFVKIFYFKINFNFIYFTETVGQAVFRELARHRNDIETRLEAERAERMAFERERAERDRAERERTVSNIISTEKYQEMKEMVPLKTPEELRQFNHQLDDPEFRRAFVRLQDYIKYNYHVELFIIQLVNNYYKVKKKKIESNSIFSQSGITW